MKKLSKMTICFILILSVLISGIGVYAYWTRFSYYNTYWRELKKDFSGTLDNYPINEYYFSKAPRDFVPKTEPINLDFRANVMRATYLGKSHRKGGKEIFYFLSNEFLVCEVEQKKIMAIPSRFSYEEWGENRDFFCSPLTYIFEYYGVEFEVGKEYLVFFSAIGIHFRYVYAPIDEEYPYIEVYPGATRYDATYFGAATKDVTKEEFVELVTAYADSL